MMKTEAAASRTKFSWPRGNRTMSTANTVAPRNVSKTECQDIRWKPTPVAAA